MQSARARSPTNGRSHSPEPPRRVSTSSSHSRKTEQDFEIALLNNDVTYLTSSPIVEETGDGSPLLAETSTPKQTVSATLGQDGVDDAPQTIENLSFEEQLRNAGRESIQRTPKSRRSSGPTTTSVFQSPALHSSLAAPPRRESVVSNDSGRASNGSTPSRLSTRKIIAQTQSLGLDAELKAQEAEMTPKRRSIFRSAGTASTPNLIRKSDKDKSAASKNNTSVTAAASQVAGVSRSSISTTTTAVSSTSSSLAARGRTVSHGSNVAATNESWDPLSSGLNKDKMTTIVESQAERPRAPSTDDGNKTVRKARGMFGRMFGSASSSKDTPFTSASQVSLSGVQQPPNSSQQPPHPQLSPDISKSHSPNFSASPELPTSPKPSMSPASQSALHFPSPPLSTTPKFSPNLQYPSSPRFHTPPPFPPPPGPPPPIPSHQPARPPIPQRPSVPIVPKAEKRGSPFVSDIFAGVSHTPEAATDELIDPLSSTELSGSHLNRLSQAVSINSLATDKPLPPVLAGEDDALGLSDRTRISHTRQSADGQYTEDSPKRVLPTSFSDDVTGLLDRIGQVESTKDPRVLSDALKKSPTLSYSGEFDPKAIRASDKSSVVLTQRSSSLPHGLNDRASQLIRASTTLSTADGDSSHYPEPLSISEITLPSLEQHASKHELSPVAKEELPDEGEASSAEVDVGGATNTTSSLSPLAPQSVRAVPSPRPQSSHSNEWSARQVAADASARSSFLESSPWGKQSPRPISASSAPIDDSVEVVYTPTLSTVNLTETEEDDEERGRQLACEFLDDDYSHVPADKIAIFLGGPRRVNNIALRYYMQYFDMRGSKLDQAFRELCAKLHLKAESQEIDRIIEGFSARYFECNPTTVFGTPGVVHTVTGAMLMLNTDLHIADLTKHMSRTDFVRNAMRAIQEGIPDDNSTPDLVRDDSGSIRRIDSLPAVQSTGSVRLRPTSTVPPPTQRSASAPVNAPAPSDQSLASPSTQDLVSRASSTTVSSFGFTKAWELDAEHALKEIYANVRTDRILLPSSSLPGSEHQSTVSLSRPGAFRSGSQRSSANDRFGALKRSSMRAVPSVLGGNNPYGSIFSASDGRLSPTGSYATSIGEQYQAFAPALGFASNLSHTVIREHEDETHSVHSQESSNSLDEMTDDELALLGAPWAKEGLLHRKIQAEATGSRKSSKKDWKQLFVVIQKGDLHMFVFGQGTSSGMSGGTVGGGNWLTNAKATGEYSLMHAIAMAMPRPGFNTNRPFCFTVTFPTGEINVFQAGTEDLVAEWVATCNYWAARKSRQPLQGGVSNMEYGWARVIDQNSVDDHDDRASMRSSRSQGGRLATYSRRTFNSGLDKVYINDWKPPPHATMPSPLDEEAQLEALETYVQSLKDELHQHKNVEDGMSRLYSPGSKNAIKARENWTAKIRYIHSEIFKYETYVEALRNAISLRVQRQGERKLERSLALSMSLHRASEDGRVTPKQRT